MTITTQSARDQYTASASQTQFSITFVFENNIDLKVYKTASGATPDPATDILTLNDDYTVTGAGYNQTNRFITLTVGATLNDIITIVRDMPLTRDTDFENSGEFSAADLNNQFDDVVAMVQQVNMKLEKLGLLYVNNQILGNDGQQNILPKLEANTGSGLPIWTTNSAGTLIAGLCAEDSGCSTLRSELVNETSGADGSTIVGYYNSTDVTEETVHDALDKLFSRPSTSSFSTGDVKPTYKITADAGWVMMNDGTIGSATSGASTRANSDTEDLFTLLWNNCADAQCPVSGGRGGSASVDFSANKTINLPRVVGRATGASGTAELTQTFTASDASGTLKLTVTSTSDYKEGMKVQFSSTGTLPPGLVASTDYYLHVVSSTELYVATSESNIVDTTYISWTSAGTGTQTLEIQYNPKALGLYEGTDSHLLLVAQIPSHRHDLLGHQFNAGGSNNNGYVGGSKNFNAYSDYTGNSESHSVIQPVSFMNYMIKL